MRKPDAKWTQRRRRATPRWLRDRCTARNQRGRPCAFLAREGGRLCGNHERQAARRREAQHRAAWHVLMALTEGGRFPSERLLRAQADLRRALRR